MNILQAQDKYQIGFNRPLNVGSIVPKDVFCTLYDYDGTILYTYTRKELMDLEEFPTPTLKRNMYIKGKPIIKFDEWSMSLEDAKRTTLPWIEICAQYDYVYDEYEMIYKINVTNSENKCVLPWISANIAINIASDTPYLLTIDMDDYTNELDKCVVEFNRPGTYYIGYQSTDDIISLVEQLENTDDPELRNALGIFFTNIGYESAELFVNSASDLGYYVNLKAVVANNLDRLECISDGIPTIFSYRGTNGSSRCYTRTMNYRWVPNIYQTTTTSICMNEDGGPDTRNVIIDPLQVYAVEELITYVPRLIFTRSIYDEDTLLIPLSAESIGTIYVVDEDYDRLKRETNWCDVDLRKTSEIDFNSIARW